MTDAKELLPCPFCGGDAHFGTIKYSPKIVAEQEWTQDTFYFVSCAVCGGRTDSLIGHATHEKALAAWNRRAALDVPVGERERLATLVSFMLQRLIARKGVENIHIGARLLDEIIGLFQRCEVQLLRTPPAVTEASPLMVQAAIDTFGMQPSYTAMKRALDAALQAAQAQRTGEDDNG